MSEHPNRLFVTRLPLRLGLFWTGSFRGFGLVLGSDFGPGLLLWNWLLFYRGKDRP